MSSFRTGQSPGFLRQAVGRISTVWAPANTGGLAPVAAAVASPVELLEETLARCESALETAPDSYDALCGAANALARIVDRDPIDGYLPKLMKARGYYRRAIAISNRESEVIFEYARICARIGPENEAKEALEETLRRNPDHAQAHELLSDLIAETSGTAAEALKHLDQAALGSQEIRSAREDELAEARTLIATGQRKPKFARYPQDELLNSDFDKAVRTTVLGDLVSVPKIITKDTGFFAMGSCFARNIAQTLRSRNYRTYNVECGEHINSTFANRALLDWTLGRAEPAVGERIAQLFGEVKPETYHFYLTDSDVVIFTLGVAPCFFDSATGAFVMPRSSALTVRALAHRYVFRTTTVAENVDNIKDIISTVRSVNKDLKIVFTLSPVPLNSTFEMDSAVQADCISKSTLRVAIHEVMSSGIPEIYYWPSFEIVRWLSGHIGKFYGKEDGSTAHVNEDIVEYIVDTFIDCFSAPAG